MRIRRRPLADPLPPLPVSPLLQRVYAARQVRSAHELDLELSALQRPDALTGIKEAASLLATALEKDWRIVIVADFDADGATSCALMMLALRALGARHLSYLIPDRVRQGYGLSAPLVEMAQAQGCDLLLTVDNGISSLEAVHLARERGMTVLVTDHHLPGDELPPAHAIVNPNLPNDPFSSKALAGVGVAFYVVLALRAHLREQGQQTLPNMAQWLDLVALGTVADVVPFDHNNRILVEQGLRRIRRGKCRPGIRALLALARRDVTQVTSTDLGYYVGPRLNAAGRLDNMALGVECLLSDDEIHAQQCANELERLNRQRRSIERRMRTEALALVEPLLERPNPAAGLCLCHPDWHQGVIGIVAGRCKEQWHRPVIAFAPDEQGELKGSARSVPGFHLRDALANIDQQCPGLILRYGGHAMAAGLSLKSEGFETFTRLFEQVVAGTLGDDVGQSILDSDGELLPGEFALETAEQLRQAGPWGQAFPTPLFDGGFRLLEQRMLKGRHLKLRVEPQCQPNTVVEAIYFNVGEDKVLDVEHLHLAYRLEVNEYLGRRNAQLVIEHLITGAPQLEVAESLS